VVYVSRRFVVRRPMESSTIAVPACWGFVDEPRGDRADIGADVGGDGVDPDRDDGARHRAPRGRLTRTAGPDVFVLGN